MLDELLPWTRSLQRRRVSWLALVAVATISVAAAGCTRGPATTSTTPQAATTSATGSPEASRPRPPVDPRLIPLAEGHNDIEAKRINIVMVRTGFPADVDWLPLARRLLSWDGPTPVTVDGGRPFGLGWGPFAVEPIKSHRQAFNVWAFAEPAPTP